MFKRHRSRLLPDDAIRHYDPSRAYGLSHMVNAWQRLGGIKGMMGPGECPVVTMGGQPAICGRVLPESLQALYYSRTLCTS
jgi:hypothetical protein